VRHTRGTGDHRVQRGNDTMGCDMMTTKKLCDMMARTKKLRVLRWSIFWAIERFICKHTHTFSVGLDDVAVWQSSGAERGPIQGIILHGCYLCGHVWVTNYRGPNGPSHPHRT
jgi:hypothetical protein